MTTTITNKLWILRPQDNLIPKNNPWHPWFDKTFGIVIRASSEDRARTIADETTKYEGLKNHPWLDSKYSSCEELKEEGPEEVIIVDFAAA